MRALAPGAAASDPRALTNVHTYMHSVRGSSCYEALITAQWKKALGLQRPDSGIDPLTPEIGLDALARRLGLTAFAKLGIWSSC